MIRKILSFILSKIYPRLVVITVPENAPANEIREINNMAMAITKTHPNLYIILMPSKYTVNIENITRKRKEV